MNNISNFKFLFFEANFFSILPKEIASNFNGAFNKLKLLLRSINGYYLCYVMDNNQMIAYCCFLKHNYFNKYRFMKKDDLLINPYYVKEEYRNNGLGSMMICEIIKHYNLKTNIYACIFDDNVSSKKVVLKNNFKQIGYLERKFIFNYLVSSKTNILVYKYDI